MARHACLKGYSIPWPARLALPGGLRLCCHATCQASSAMSRQEHAASALACLACAQGGSLILPTQVTCNKCAGRGAKAGCRRAGHPGCSSQHSPSPFPQAQASAYRCPGHIQACPVKLMCSLHLLCAASPDWPWSHMRQLLLQLWLYQMLSMAARHSCACTCFEMLLHPTTVKGNSAQGAQGRAYSSCRFHHKSVTRRL